MVSAWPVLREEIDLLAGPRLADGQPSWTLHDPTRNRFFSIDWPSFEILQRWSYGDSKAIAHAITNETTLMVADDDVNNFASFLIENQLVQPKPNGSARELAQRVEKMQGGALTWVLHHYLFFRLPLWNPDAWLSRWQSVADFFFRPSFVWITLVVFCFGTFQVAKQWDTFAVTLVDTLTWSGLIAYGVGLAVVKLLHELGHAFTAKRLGCRVPAMGVAFLVMFPVAYTDTNETWRLTSHRQRLQVASAGIVTELFIAAWATVAWAFLPDGSLRSVAFFLATTSWVATLAINASPFLRFDGYFILSDLVDIPNLHDRSFALARWKLREWLFGLGEDCPEHFPPRRERALIAFAFVTWIYRLIVFVGIAILVYQFFFKLLGVLLFVVELAWFIAMPVRRELSEWGARWPQIKRSRKSLRTMVWVLLLIIMFVLPWPNRINASGMMRSSESLAVMSPARSYLAVDPPAEGRAFSKGDVLFRLVSPELESRRAVALARLDRLRWQSSTASLNADARTSMQSLKEEMVKAEAELEKVNVEIGFLSPKAPFDGVLRDVDPDLAAGQWLGVREPLGLFVKNGSSVVETYLDEEAVKRISVGDHGIFIPDGREGSVIPIVVEHIDADATRKLSDGMLSAQFGGHILSREKKGEIVPELSVYRVRLATAQSVNIANQQSIRGDVVIRAAWESPLFPFLRNVAAVLIREVSF